MKDEPFILIIKTMPERIYWALSILLKGTIKFGSIKDFKEKFKNIK